MSSRRPLLLQSALAPVAVVLLSAFALPGCGGDDDVPPPHHGGTGGGAGANGLGGTGGTSQESPGAAGDTGAPSHAGMLGPAQAVVLGSPSVVGLTSDDWILYRDGETLKAIAVDGGDPVDVSDDPGNVLVEGKVAYNFANVDWTKNLGDLSIWSAAGGAQKVGTATYSEVLVSASASGDWLVYPTKASKGKLDLMIASADFATNDVLIEGMGLGSDDTCSPTLGFAGERLIVGYCDPGSREAKVVRFERDGKKFAPTTIAENALSSWSADATGDGVFYQSDAYEGWYAAGDERSRIDASVSRGFVLPDGTAVLYTVGDQLRRSSVPDSNPVPVVTTGFSEPVAFTTDHSYVLYSSKVTYDNGTQRDLRLVATDGFNPEPIELVADPVATTGRSSFTTDGGYVLYLSDTNPRGGTLHVVDLAGNEVAALPGVVDVVAAHDSTIVFTDNASDPDIYPNVADLEVLDVASATVPTLVEASIMETKNFQVDSTGTRVLFVRSGVDRDAEDPERSGLFMADLP